MQLANQFCIIFIIDFVKSRKFFIGTAVHIILRGVDLFPYFLIESCDPFYVAFVADSFKQAILIRDSSKGHHKIIISCTVTRAIICFNHSSHYLRIFSFEQVL